MLFLPVGVLAFYYYTHARREFVIGRRRNDLRATKKSATTCERFVLLSFVCGVLTYSLIYVLLHETTWKHHHRKTLG